MDQQLGLRLAGMALTNGKSVTVELTIKEMWLLLGAAQLVVAIDGLHQPLKDDTEAVGRKLQVWVKEELPQVDELAEAGWDRSQDYVEPSGDDWNDDWDDDYEDDWQDSEDEDDIITYGPDLDEADGSDD